VQKTGGVTIWRIQPSTANAAAGVDWAMQPIPRQATGRAKCIAFSPDSKLLAYVETDFTVHLWELETARQRPFPHVQLLSDIRCMAFHPDGSHLIFIADSGAVEVWDVATGQKAFSLGGKESNDVAGVPAGFGGIIALSSEGHWLASGYTGFVIIWDMASKKVLLKLPEEQAYICTVAWSPKQELLAVGSSDGGLVIWNLPKIKAHLDAVGLGW
jgi:WD40 repeat protein